MIAILLDGDNKLFGDLHYSVDYLQFTPLQVTRNDLHIRIPLSRVSFSSYYYIYELKIQGITVHCHDIMTYTFIVHKPYLLMQDIQRLVMRHRIQNMLITDN